MGGLSGRARLARVVPCAALLATLLPAQHATAAQDGVAGGAASGDVRYAAANALLGGLTGGIASSARGRPFLGGFWRGALGGGVSYLGKRLSAAAFPGAGLAGRQVGAAGASMVRSAAFGSGLLDTLVVPVGPARLYLPVERAAWPTLRLDLEESFRLLHNLVDNRLDLDLARTLSAGSFVFTSQGGLSDDRDTSLGRAAAGTISLRRTGDGVDEPSFAHERVHIVQFDYLKIVGGLPAEGWPRRELGIGWGSALHHVEVGLAHYPLVWYSRPVLEMESEHFEAIRATRR